MKKQDTERGEIYLMNRPRFGVPGFVYSCRQRLFLHLPRSLLTPSVKPVASFAAGKRARSRDRYPLAVDESLLYLVPAKELGAIIGECRNPIECHRDPDLELVNWT